MRLRKTRRRLWQWLWRGRVLIAGILWPILLLGLCCLLLLCFTSALSTAGTLLQLSGFVLILRGIRRVARRFEEPHLHLRVWNWIRDLKEVWNPTPVVVKGGVAAGSPKIGGQASVGYPDAETLEERVSVLESRVENLRESHDALREMTEERLDSLESRADELEKKLTSEREKILDTVEEITREGLDWEFVAVVWLALGVSFRLLASWM